MLVQIILWCLCLAYAVILMSGKGESIYPKSFKEKYNVQKASKLTGGGVLLILILLLVDHILTTIGRLSEVNANAIQGTIIIIALTVMISIYTSCKK